MRDSEIKPANSETPSNPPQKRRLRRFLLQHVPLSILTVVLFAVVALYFWISSSSFERIVHNKIISVLETATGGRVEIASFHWKPLHLEAEAGGLVLHGLERPEDVPYAQIENLHIKVSILELISPRVLLRDLEIVRPQLHLIIYPDGTTNQPHPRYENKTSKPVLDTLFDLQAGQLTVQQGVVHIEKRTASGSQTRFLPVDFNAQDVGIKINYAQPSGKMPESYHIETAASDLSIVRGNDRPAHARIEATLDLTHSATYLRSMRISSEGPARNEKHIFEVSGQLEDFSHPHWQMHTQGELDMRLIYSYTGYASSPEGITRADLNANGEPDQFHVDGNLHVNNGAYLSPGVNEHGITLDANVHADAQQLLISSIIARLHQGGQLEGTVDLKHWLAQQGDTNTIPVSGKVTAKLENVSLDTVLDIVGKPPFQRIGLNSLLNGPATAIWTNGDNKTLTVDAVLNMSPGNHAVSGEVPTAGLVDAVYAQHNGSVNIRKLNLYTPASTIDASGNLGAYPLTSNTGLTVKFHSGNLSEFDTVLAELGLKRNGKIGTAALPVSLNGQADFQGTWSGSLAHPRIAGDVKAAQISIEMPSAFAEKIGASQSNQPRLIQWDDIEAKCSYSDEKISIDHGMMRRGNTAIALDGSLTVSEATDSMAFDANSALHLRMRANKVGLDDLLPLAGLNLQLKGPLDAQVQVDGPLHSLRGSGWVELNNGNIYGQPIAHLRADGTIDQQVLKISSLQVSEASGKLSGTGSINLDSKQYQLDAHGIGLEVASIEWLRQHQIQANGKLALTISGAGTLNDPHMDAHATSNNLSLSGGPLGTFEMTAHTANHMATYEATARLESAELNLKGKTLFNTDYSTQANLKFARYNIGTLLKAAHIHGLEGESAMAGNITVSGPLARPEEFQGDARLNEVAMTVAGVHLKSEGEAHATLLNSRIQLDPLHVIGEDTDLRAQGTLALKGNQQLDFAANGSINLKLLQTIDPDVTASGATTFQVEAHGPLSNPGMRGRIDIQNGALSLGDIPNGLSQLHGTLEFNQNRLEVRSLTAMSGGGQLNFSGYLTYQRGLYADLSVSGKDVRIRYPQGVSSLADTTLHLQGTQNSMLLSGNLQITRFALSPDFDIATLAAQANSVPSIAPADAPSNHIRMDVHITSSPQLNFKNAYAKLAGDVDMRLRGTVASPSLLGRISVSEGSATIAGTRYDLQRGDITFSNPVRIEPFIDLSATARAQDYDITLSLHGTPNKLAVAYHSDPPLPEADVVALLALGRTESQQRLYTQQQERALANPTTDALLGGALNATVSSRVQKLFGAGSVKVDPNYIGALGNSTSRIIVEEQLGRALTFTYATNVNTTSQQLLQAEVAVNRHISLLIARDESGVFSMVLKFTRHHR